MAHTTDIPAGRPVEGSQGLLAIVRAARRRWRLRLLLRGAAITLVGGLAAVLLATWAMDQFRYSPTAVTLLRGFTYLGLAALAAWSLVRPLLVRARDEQIALYLEEHEPDLQGIVSSALGAGAPGPAVSRALAGRRVARAVEQCHAVEDGRRIERAAIRRSGGVLAGATVFGLAAVLLGPGFLREGAPFLFTPWRGDVASPYAIGVVPGNATVARGSDLEVRAVLQNFASEAVELAVRRGGGVWERFPMVPDTGAGWSIVMFDLDSTSEYFVEASGVRTPRYRVEVADLPAVAGLELEYRFPAYTGLPPQIQEDDGDIAALAGTVVEVRITTTIPMASGALLVQGRDTVPLQPADSLSARATLRVAEPGSYRILLAGSRGGLLAASPDYVIDVLEDQPPVVTISAPGRDIQATSVEEVFIEATARDDHGVRGLELVYTVNGGAERVVPLGGGQRKELTGAHTLFMEEYGLAPGDLVAYYARARDGNPRQPGPSASDIYFIRVRPFDRAYRQAEQQGMPGEAPQGSELSDRQREIIAATFKLERDRRQYGDREFGENVATVALMQGRLREDVQVLLERMHSRGVVELDSALAQVAEALPLAIAAMSAAEERLATRATAQALPPEQQALQQLQRAEAAFREVQVSRQQGGGGGGGAETDPENLADLFGLEMDRQNQYEQVQRGEQRNADAEVDEALERLRELARRQQQQNERLAAQARQQQSGAGGGGGAAQRQMAREMEELARRLERLSRERSEPDLASTAQELREAAQAMRRAAAGDAQSGQAQGRTALDRIREATRQLEQNQGGRLERDLEDLERRAGRLAEQQRDIAGEAEAVAGNPDAKPGEVRRLQDRKEAMAGELADIERDLDRLGRENRTDQPDAARRLDEAANALRQYRLRERVLFSRGLLQNATRDYVRAFEEQITQGLEGLGERIRQARGSVRETPRQRMAEALDNTRDLVNALESLGERLEQGRGGRPAGEGQEGQGQEGQAQQQGGSPAGGAAPVRPRDNRQIQRELGQRRGELDALRRGLIQEGVDVADLDRLLANLGRMENLAGQGNLAAVEALQREVVQGLKEFEFALRRSLGGDAGDRLYLTGGDNVPPEYRALVEEYYRRLSREGQQ